MLQLDNHGFSLSPHNFLSHRCSEPSGNRWAAATALGGQGPWGPLVPRQGSWGARSPVGRTLNIILPLLTLLSSGGGWGERRTGGQGDRGTDRKAESEMRNTQSRTQKEGRGTQQLESPDRKSEAQRQVVTGSGSHSRQLQSRLPWHTAQLQRKQSKSH